MHSSAFKNFANIIADASEPLLPIVVILKFELIPWKPATIGMPPSFIYFFISWVLIFEILAFEWFPSVKIGSCHDNHDLELYPKDFRFPAINAQAACSPVDNKASYSAMLH